MTGRSATTGSDSPLWAANPLLSTEFFLTVGLLIVVLLGGAVVFFFVDRWRKQQLSPSRDSTETLTTFREMYERGELTETEYRKVRDRVAARMRDEVALPAVGAEGGSPPPARPPAGGPEDSAPQGPGATVPPPENPPD